MQKSNVRLSPVKNIYVELNQIGNLYFTEFTAPMITCKIMGGGRERERGRKIFMNVVKFQVETSYTYNILKTIYFMAVALKYMLIGFGPVVYFDAMRGINIFTTDMDVLIIAMSSFETPASMSFKDVTLSVTQNPILNADSIVVKTNITIKNGCNTHAPPRNNGHSRLNYVLIYVAELW